MLFRDGPEVPGNEVGMAHCRPQHLCLVCRLPTSTLATLLLLGRPLALTSPEHRKSGV